MSAPDCFRWVAHVSCRHACHQDTQRLDRPGSAAARGVLHAGHAGHATAWQGLSGTTVGGTAASNAQSQWCDCCPAGSHDGAVPALRRQDAADGTSECAAGAAGGHPARLLRHAAPRMSLLCSDRHICSSRRVSANGKRLSPPALQRERPPGWSARSRPAANGGGSRRWIFPPCGCGGARRLRALLHSSRVASQRRKRPGAC